MRAKRVLSAIASAILLLGSGGLALAQAATTSAVPLHETEDDAMIVQPFNLSVEDLEDMDLIGPNGEEIGEVEDVLVDESGQLAAISVDVGGFLGIAAKEVAISIDQLRLENNTLTTSLTQEQLEALPEWEE